MSALGSSFANGRTTRARTSLWHTCCATRACSRKPRGDCDAARALDPQNREFRSCGEAFAQFGDFAKARSYFALDDSSSTWRRNHEAQLLLREDKSEAAVRVLEE